MEKSLIKLGVEASELQENFILGSGSGGQKVNKTSSCVQLVYKGMEVRCQESRSRETNRYLAREELCRRIEEGKRERGLAKKQAREKNRRRNRQRSPAQKRRMLDDKNKRSLKKQRRGKVRRDD